MAPKTLARRAEEGVCGRVIVELGTIKQRTVSLIVDRAIRRYMQSHALGFTGCCLFSIGVPSIGYYMQLPFRMSCRLLSCLGHRLQTAIVDRFIFDLLGHH